MANKQEDTSKGNTTQGVKPMQVGSENRIAEFAPRIAEGKTKAPAKLPLKQLETAALPENLSE